MGAKRNNMIALATAGLFIVLGICGAAQAQLQSETRAEAQSHEQKAFAFTRDLGPALDHRLNRIIDLDRFAQMNREANTVILDTRSRAAFASGHIYGAVNVPLSEMTLLNLGDAIEDRETRILIYGDENIDEVAGRSDYEISSLPINLLTYISLHRYGYYELFELGEKASLKDERIDWADEPQIVASLTEASFN